VATENFILPFCVSKKHVEDEINGYVRGVGFKHSLDRAGEYACMDAHVWKLMAFIILGLGWVGLVGFKWGSLCCSFVLSSK